MKDLFALWLELSNNGVKLIKMAIDCNLSFVICPLRDPTEANKKWLVSLGVKKIIYSDQKPELANDFISCSVDDFLPEKRSVHEFLSIIRTSGTSGNPKSVKLTKEAHLASARSVNQYFSLNSQSCFALCMPLYHVSGLSIIFRTLLAKASIYVAKDHESLKSAINSNIITHLSLVPTQLKRLLDDQVPLNKLCAVIVGGDALPDHLRELALKAGTPLFETYGLTETASMVWVKPSHKPEGGLLPHAKMQIVDKEILVGGESLFSGYVEQDHKGMFPTGDVVDEQEIKNLKLISRKSNRIISGGENIQAEEVERVIKSHPQVLDCVVVPHVDDIFGMRPKAFIKWQKTPIPDQELYNYILKHLAAFKLPKIIKSWPEDVPVGMKNNRSWFINTQY
jgi:O-succinylbenzoic acid--CoA ligase